MLVRFRSDVIDLDPDVVVILAGINDIAENTGPSSVKTITDNIISMSELAIANNIKGHHFIHHSCEKFSMETRNRPSV